ncbi:isoprenylcysteine carboxylmethyltransferase family protein [Microbacterium sp. cx-59]|uniref:methyltransferase family protein n=1 Tax=Microbacterium sp. cx-59 TaxID=2891207 RepID=UPI001E567323|nr:isoprenylcysteine carboxylmethyltransferase family protein [Microbacterium sp. cx-59]MCC4909200.1 isoprenylcysteine carboxylmethyltransferase family protein [Microbacterium sp. cx-59]
MVWGRAYFAVQAVAGAGWWLAVFLVPAVRRATLGGLDPLLVAAFDVPLFVAGSVLAACGVSAAAVIATLWTAMVAVLLVGYATMTGTAGWGAVLMIAAAVASALALGLVLWGRVPTHWLLIGPFRFRAADRAAPVSRHVAATGLQILVFWGLTLGVLPAIIRWFEVRWQVDVPVPAVVVIAGAGIFVAASALGIWSAVVMSTLGRGTPLPAAMASDLVVRGPYRFVRNPMALAGIVQGTGVGLMLSSWLVVVYAVCGSLVWNYAIRPLEERDLEERFGDDFRRYRSAVRCWCPRWRPVAATIAAGIT